MNHDELQRQGGRAVLLLVVLLATVVAGSALVRRVAVPSWLGYLPREHQVLVVTGDLAALWMAIDDHFGHAIRDTEREGWLASLAAALAEPFDESGVPVRSVEALERHGFDVARGAAWSFGLPGRAEPAVFVLVPVADRARVLEWFRKLQDGPERATHRIAGAPGDVELLEFDTDTWLAFPEPGVALLSDSRALIERSVRQRDATWHYRRNDDALSAAVVRLRGSGGRAFVHWQHAASPLRSATALLTLDADTVRVTVTAHLARGGLQIVEDLLGGATGDGVSDEIPPDSATLLTLDDPAIPRYMRFASRFAGAARFMDESYGGILATLGDTAGLDGVSVAVTGYRDGLPEIVLTLEGDPKVLERIVARQQVRQAEQRDRRVLEGALAAWRAIGRAPATTVGQLERAGLLAADAALGDYTVTDGGVNGAPSRERFAAPAYRGPDGAVRYLAPPRNANDLRYVLDRGAEAGAEEDEAPIDATAFLDDRFRLATTFVDGRLVVATDATALQALLEGGRTVEPPVWQSLVESGARGKLRVGVDVGRAIELGLLTPEPDVQEWVRHYAMDFAEHPAALGELRSDPLAGTVSFDLVLARGAALGRRR